MKTVTYLWDTAGNRRFVKSLSPAKQKNYALVAIPMSNNQKKRYIKWYVLPLLPEFKTNKERNEKILVLMGAPKPTGVVKAILALPDDHNDCVARLADIRADLDPNIYVTTSGPVLAALDLLIETFTNAHGDARKPALDALVEALNDIMYQFQKFANLPANKANSIVIIHSANFEVQGVGGKTKQAWGATKGVAGEILITAEVVDGNVCHAWWYSADLITWVMIYPTPLAETSMSGLVPGAWAHFRHELIYSTGPSGVIDQTSIQVGS